MSIYIKFFCGGYMGLTLSTDSDDLVPSMWYPLLLYYTCMDSGEFSCKTDSTRHNCQMYTWMKAGDMKKENQIKSKLFHGKVSTRKGE